MKRVFLALWPGEQVATAVHQAAAGWPWPKSARRYAREDLHLTLHFIGPLPDDRITDLRRLMRRPFEPFDLRLDQPALWSSGLAVLTPSVVPDSLIRLHRHLGDALRGAGLEPGDRGFAAHMTLARRCQGMALPAAIPAVPWRVTDYALAVSTGDPLRRYEVIARYRGA